MTWEQRNPRGEAANMTSRQIGYLNAAMKCAPGRPKLRFLDD